MIKFENTEVVGWEAAIRGMRNPMNSWGKSDSGFGCERGLCGKEDGRTCDMPYESMCNSTEYIIGPNDYDLMKRLCNAGIDHRKFMRMITVYVDITAPLYWWKEFDTYKVGTVANSCSTMHKIHEKEFTLEDFSFEHLLDGLDAHEDGPIYCQFMPLDILSEVVIPILNKSRNKYLETKDKKYLWQMIQILPSSYNQKRTVMMNYEVLANIYKSRKNHKLDEWSEHSCNTTVAKEWGKSVYLGFCDWITTLPYSELITGESLSDIPICNEIMEEAKKRVKVEENE
jgi:hypothetical protein